MRTSRVGYVVDFLPQRVYVAFPKWSVILRRLLPIVKAADLWEGKDASQQVRYSQLNSGAILEHFLYPGNTLEYVGFRVDTRRHSTRVDTRRHSTRVDTRRYSTRVDTRRHPTRVDTRRHSTPVDTRVYSTRVDTPLHPIRIDCSVCINNETTH